MELLTTVAIAAGIPSAVVGFGVWCIERKITKADKKREKEEQKRAEEEKEREKLREKQELLLVQGVNAAIALGEATAKAVQRIPDAHCNGDMETALEEEEKVKKEIQLFLAKQGVNNIIT